MEGSWPVILSGIECGSVTARHEGAYSVFSAEAACAAEGVVRISLYGGGREGYLGVLAPDPEGVWRLTRRLTRTELSGFPAAPEYAAESGGKPPAEPEPEDAGTQSEAEKTEAEPETAPPARPEELWYAAPDGTLSRFDGKRLLVAIPSSGVRVPDWATGVVQRINGREYVVFPR